MITEDALVAIGFSLQEVKEYFRLGLLPDIILDNDLYTQILSRLRKITNKFAFSTSIDTIRFFIPNLPLYQGEFLMLRRQIYIEHVINEFCRLFKHFNPNLTLRDVKRFFNTDGYELNNSPRIFDGNIFDDENIIDLMLQINPDEIDVDINITEDGIESIYEVLLPQFQTIDTGFIDNYGVLELNSRLINSGTNPIFLRSIVKYFFIEYLLKTAVRLMVLDGEEHEISSYLIWGGIFNQNTKDIPILNEIYTYYYNYMGIINYTGIYGVNNQFQPIRYLYDYTDYEEWISERLPSYMRIEHIDVISRLLTLIIKHNSPGTLMTDLGIGYLSTSEILESYLNDLIISINHHNIDEDNPPNELYVTYRMLVYALVNNHRDFGRLIRSESDDIVAYFDENYAVNQEREIIAGNNPTIKVITNSETRFSSTCNSSNEIEDSYPLDPIQSDRIPRHLLAVVDLGNGNNECYNAKYLHNWWKALAQQNPPQPAMNPTSRQEFDAESIAFVVSLLEQQPFVEEGQEGYYYKIE